MILRSRVYTIKIKIHSSCEIEYIVETHLCKLCVILRSRVLRVVCLYHNTTWYMKQLLVYITPVYNTSNLPCCCGLLQKRNTSRHSGWLRATAVATSRRRSFGGPSPEPPKFCSYGPQALSKLRALPAAITRTVTSQRLASLNRS